MTTKIRRYNKFLETMKITTMLNKIYPYIIDFVWDRDFYAKNGHYHFKVGDVLKMKHRSSFGYGVDHRSSFGYGVDPTLTVIGYGKKTFGHDGYKIKRLSAVLKENDETFNFMTWMKNGIVPEGTEYKTAEELHYKSNIELHFKKVGIDN